MVYLLDKLIGFWVVDSIAEQILLKLAPPISHGCRGLNPSCLILLRPAEANSIFHKKNCPWFCCALKMIFNRGSVTSALLVSVFKLLLAKIYNFWQVCSFVGVSVCLSVSLSVLSSITHERFDISSPNLVHIWNGWAVPVCDIDK